MPEKGNSNPSVFQKYLI